MIYPSFSNDHASIKGFDAKIGELQRDLAALQNRRNALLPVSRLPAEVLCHIFAHCVPSSARQFPKDRKWFFFTHVTRRWRDVALACPSLWTRPWFAIPQIATMMLQRSKPVPLHIRWKMSEPTEESRLHEITETLVASLVQGERIRELNVDIDLNLLERIAPPDVLRSFPLLESLAIDVAKEWEQELGQAPRFASFFQPVAPRLRFLKLSGIALSWKATIFRNLSTLSLGYTNSNETGTWANVWEALQEMSCLQSLSLKNALPEDPAEHARRTIELPRLVYLCVQDVPLGVSAVLQSLSLSPQLRLDVRFYCRDLAQPVNSAIFTALHGFLRASDRDSPLRCIHIGFSTPSTSMAVRVWNTSDMQSVPKFYLWCRASDFGLEHIFYNPMYHPWSYHIETLFIEDTCALLDVQVWYDLFPVLANVSYIKVVGTEIAPLACALAEDAREASTAEDLAFQRLHTLVFTVEFPAIWNLRWDSELERALHTRGALGVPLHELRAPTLDLQLLELPLLGVMNTVTDDDAGQNMNFGVRSDNNDDDDE